MFAFFLFIINMGENVNILAHLGGLVCGLILGYWTASRRKPEQQVSWEFKYHNTPF
jgi:membrane associated rhomboid family serine protease